MGVSRSQQILGSVAVWTLIVLASALVPYFGFGLDPQDTDLGGAFIIWIVGYVLQLGMIYLVNAATGHPRAWPFFVASLLPWAADWSITLGGAAVGVVVLVVLAVGAAMAVLPMRHLWLEENGRPVVAKVLRVLRNPFNIVMNYVYIRRRVELEIPAPDGSTYKGTIGMLYEIGTAPSPGDEVRIRVDPRNRRRFILDSPGSTPAV
jgi:hypothetical protein